MNVNKCINPVSVRVYWTTLLVQYCRMDTTREWLDTTRTTRTTRTCSFWRSLK